MWTNDSSVHVRPRISMAHHERYRRFFADQWLRQQVSRCPSCQADLFAAEREGELRDLTGALDIGKALRLWQRARRQFVRPGARPPEAEPQQDAAEAPDPSLTNNVRCAIILEAGQRVPPPTPHYEEEPPVTVTATSAPAEQPAPPPPARSLLAQLTGQSKAGQAVKVTLEESSSAAKTVFLTIITDGDAAPAEKFLGLQKARAHARLMAIKKELQGAKLERFDEPEPEPAPAPAPLPKATRQTTSTPAKPAKPGSKSAPAAPAAPARVRDQTTAIKVQGRFTALMVVGPSSRYEVWRDHGLATAHKEWEVKATRSWQPQQRAAKEKVEELFQADPSPLPVQEVLIASVPAPEPPALVLPPDAPPALDAAPVLAPTPAPAPAPAAGKRTGGKKSPKQTPAHEEPAL